MAVGQSLNKMPVPSCYRTLACDISPKIFPLLPSVPLQASSYSTSASLARSTTVTTSQTRAVVNPQHFPVNHVVNLPRGEHASRVAVNPQHFPVNHASFLLTFGRKLTKESPSNQRQQVKAGRTKHVYVHVHGICTPSHIPYWSNISPMPLLLLGVPKLGFYLEQATI